MRLQFWSSRESEEFLLSHYSQIHFLYLVVRLQFWSSRESKELLLSRYSQIHFLTQSVGLLNTPTTSLQRGKAPDHPNECFTYNTKQSDAEVSVMLELWGMRSTPSLPSLPGSLWLGVVAPDKILCMGQIALFNILTVYLCNTELLEIKLFDHLTVCKQMTDV